MSQVPEFNPKPLAPAPEAPVPVEPALTKETATVTMEPAPAVAAPAPEPTPNPTPVETKREPVQPVGPEKTLTTVIEIRDIGEPTMTGMKKPESSQSAQPKIVAKPSSLSPGQAASAPASKEEDFTRDPKAARTRVKLLLFVLLLGGGLYGLKQAGMLAGIEGKISSLISTLPEIPDVDPAEYEMLKATVKTPASAGPAVAIAVSKEDPLSPIFYVATNLSDGAQFEVYIEGIPHTLLNTFSFTGKLEVTTLKRLAKSSPLRYPDGKVIPRGEYNIYVVEKPTGQSPEVEQQLSSLTAIARKVPGMNPDARKIFYTRVLFLGQKDASYLTRLKEFHDKVAQKASQELQEIRQLVTLIESQYGSATANFDRLKKQKIGPLQVKAWAGFTATWQQLDSQLRDSFAKLTPELLASDYYHPNLYQKTQEVAKLLSQMQASQDSVFTKRVPIQTADPQVIDQRLNYEKALGELKAALESVEKNPVDQHGIPRKAVL